MTMLRLPVPNSKARFLLIGYGLILLVWMSLEDNGTIVVAVLGTGAALIFISYWLLSRIGGRELPIRLWFSGLIVLGSLIGAAATLVTTILMFFKSSWHGHLFPDYPPTMIAAMLSRMPIWALAGGLFGLSVAIIILLRQTNTSLSNQPSSEKTP